MPIPPVMTFSSGFILVFVMACAACPQTIDSSRSPAREHEASVTPQPGSASASAANTKAEKPSTKSVHRPPSLETDLPPGKLGETIRYGYELLNRFPYYLGPKGSIGQYGGNGLACGSCHLDAGRVPYGLNYFTVYGRYPQYRGREAEILTLSQRINNCIQRPMSGKPMPLDSKEMTAMVTYMKWMAEGVPVGENVPGDKLHPIELPKRPADPVKGKAVYNKHCISCHQADGQGVINPDGISYLYPPVWGIMSYQPGSSMHRVLKAAQFIKYNMPRGVTWENPILTDEEAIDVAAYINDDSQHIRPTSKESKAEYPIPADKPVSYHKGPFADPFEDKQHKFGPWREIVDWRKENGQTTGY